jgi:ATP-dependent DNA ligase
MYGYIDGIDFVELPAEKYWSFPKSYKGDKKEETKYMVKSGIYIGSLKQDGHYARFIKDEDGNMILQGRSKSVSGDYLNKIEWVPQCQDFFDSLPNGTCLLGELYFPNQKGSRKTTTILGCLKSKAIERQEKGEKLCYYVFDVWAYNGQSLLNTPFEQRIEKYLNYEFIDLFIGEKYIIRAQYYEGEELWSKIGEYLVNGEEGVVITKKDSLASPGKRTARKTLKIKQEINETIDAFLDGGYKPATKDYKGKSNLEDWNYWINEKTGETFDTCKFNEYVSGEPYEPITKAYCYGWASAVSFSVMKNGEPVHIGYISGITDTLKKEIVKNPEKWINKVAELTAMEIEKSDSDSGYSLRHGKIVQFRDDKSYLDCEFSQLESNS